jgi:DnaJ-class molecular chaperone
MDACYRTLGVNENISDDDLRKTYLKLAKRYHPDKNDGKNEAFKLLTSCYEKIVENRNKHVKISSETFVSNEHITTNNKPIINIFLNEDEIVNGCNKMYFTYEKYACFDCNSTGIHNHTHNVILCKKCNGGIDRKSGSMCVVCRGISRVVLNDIKCKMCGGSGTVEETIYKNIELSAFVEDNTLIVQNTHNLHINHRLKFVDKIMKQTLFITVPITLIDAFVGFRKEIRVGENHQIVIESKNRGLFNFDIAYDVVHNGLSFNIRFNIVFADDEITKKTSKGLEVLIKTLFPRETKCLNDDIDVIKL